jgi:hypothetical protein
MVYASIWDWRINHIPLNRAVAFPGAGAELENAVFTRQVCWGMVGGGNFGEKHGLGNGSGEAGRMRGTGVGGNGYGYAASPSRKPVGSGHQVRTGSDNIV